MTTMLPHQPYFSTEPPPEIIEVDPAVLDRQRQDRLKYKMLDPTPDPAADDPIRICVAYAWSELHQIWYLLGFYRTKRTLTLGRVQRIRDRIMLPEHVTVKVMDLYFAAAFGPGDPPARSHPTWRPCTCHQQD